jgi:hypothetical protein
MSDEIVERIVGCAHGDKLKTAAHILKETHWCENWVDDHTDSLLALIKTYRDSIPAIQVIPLSASTSESTQESTPPLKQQRALPKCSRCRQEGHIGAYICWPPQIHELISLFLVQLPIKTVLPKSSITVSESLRWESQLAVKTYLH